MVHLRMVGHVVPGMSISWLLRLVLRMIRRRLLLNRRLLRIVRRMVRRLRRDRGRK
jgi:hypothetical protein